MASTQDPPTDNIAWCIYVGTITTIVPATIVVISRYLARHVAKAGFWWDDYTIGLALMINWALAATKYVQIAKYNFGQNGARLPPDQLFALGKSLLATQMLYFTNTVVTKASLLLLYYRIFGVVRKFRWTLGISGGLVIGYYIACVIVLMAGCSPISKLWDPTIPGRCINELAFFRWNGVANLLLDVLILCLPYPMAWRLQTTVRQKWILTGIFLLGGFVCVASILRITSFDFNTLGNPTYVSVIPSTWSSIEQSVGIICACLPTLRPLIRLLYGRSANSVHKRNSASSDPPSRPLSNRLSQRDEENSLDSLKTSSSPTPLTSQVNPQSMHEASPRGTATADGTLEKSNGEWDRHIHRPESFA